ncbi:hypothetical protein GQ457_08G025560 [Hibiscus cannabinus]
MCRLEFLVDVDVVIASLGKARRQGGSSITIVQCISGLEYWYMHGGIGTDSSLESVYRYSLIGTGTALVSVPCLGYRYFDTGIGTTPLSTDIGSLEQLLGVLGSMISYVLVPELAVYDFMSLNDSFDSKFHTRACKTTNYVLVTLK